MSSNEASLSSNSGASTPASRAVMFLAPSQTIWVWRTNGSMSGRRRDAKQDGGIDLVRLRMGARLVDDGVKRLQGLHENRDSGLIKQGRHGRCSLGAALTGASRATCTEWRSGSMAARKTRPADSRRRRARRFSRRRRLAFDARDRLIDARPARRLGRPDRRRRAREFGIVERAGAHEDEMRARLGLAEQMGSACRAKAPMHDRAAVGDAAIVAQSRPKSLIALLWKGRVHGRVAGADILAQATPAAAASRSARRRSHSAPPCKGTRR